MTPTQIGKYEILAEIGRGGFAVVYQARDTTLDRVVALKVLHAHWATEPQFATRFRQEARAAANLRHPNIVPVYDTGEADGQLYIAMAYLPGQTLHDRLEANGPLSLEQALPILEQLADALDYAHAQGVVHRDVKPVNVMVEDTARGPIATLMDFGLVRALESSTALTSQGTLLGSPEYMAPEQADPNRHAEIGPATDRYALGILTYRMLAGRVPFPGNTPGTLNAHLNLGVPDPRRFVQDLPQKVTAALLKMLAKSPANRFPTAGAFVARLREINVVYCQGGQGYARQIGADVDGINTGLKMATLPPPTPLPVRRFKILQLPGWAVVLAVVVLLGLAGWALRPLFVSGVPAATPSIAPTTISPLSTSQPGQIAFTVYENGRLMLYLAQTDGSNQQNLNIPGWAPTWSPDGRSIAFLSDRSGAPQLYSVSADGGTPTRLTDSPEGKMAPAWSPADQWIAFIAQTSSGGAIHLIDTQGISRRTIITTDVGDVAHLTWSPNGQQLLFDARRNGEQRVYSIGVDGTGLQQLTNFETWQPAWSPDGERIAVAAEGGIYTFNKEGSNRLRLTTFQAWGPVWSPDGRSIAFLSDRGVPGERPELWLMETNGWRQRQMTRAGCQGYVWSPDGQELAYLTGSVVEAAEVYLEVINIETDAQRRIAPASASDLSWKP